MMLKRAFLLIALIVSPTWVFGADADIAKLKTDISNATDIKKANDLLDTAVNAVNASEKYKSISAASDVAKSAQTKVKTAKENALKKVEATDKRTDEQKAEDLKKLEDDYKAKKENEQSLANRTLTAATTAATGIGGMELAMGLSQQKADKDAAADMDAYIATFRCTYADGKSVKGGPDEIELPSGNTDELMKLRTEYVTLAADLKQRKEALGLKPGIEAEEILDKTQMGLYDDEFVGITSGNYESLYRAKALGSEADQAKIDENAKSAKNRVIAGGVVAGAGVLGGVVGNSLINGKLGELIKNGKEGDAVKQFVKDEENALKTVKNCLQRGGVKNTNKLTWESMSPLYPSLFSFDKLSCNKDLTRVKGEDAEELFKIFKNGTFEEFIDRMVEKFGNETTGKLLDVTISDPMKEEEKTKAAEQFKTRAEELDKKLMEAKEKDEQAANNNKSNSTGIGAGLGNMLGNVDFSGLKDKATNLIPTGTAQQ